MGVSRMFQLAATTHHPSRIKQMNRCNTHWALHCGMDAPIFMIMHWRGRPENKINVDMQPSL